MPFKAQVISNTVDVVAELESMSLSVNILHDVLRHVRAIKNDQTEDHPSWGRGITPASEGVFKLRQLTRANGWRRDSESKFELTVHDGLGIALNIAKGNSATGEKDQNPETAYPKGVCTISAVSNNQLLLDLPPPPLRVVSETNDKFSTWYLLHSNDGEFIRSEVSLPVGMSSEKHVSLWTKRLILPAIKLDSLDLMPMGVEPAKAEVKLIRKRKV